VVRTMVAQRDLTPHRYAMVPPLQRRGEVKGNNTFPSPLERGDRCAATVGEVPLLQHVKTFPRRGKDRNPAFVMIETSYA
jgi:hypothetical protein